ncbi:hypothetical protein BBJ28_00009494 [Nothophytophthora sp. Chile5]|nr:hypothetical protein BBJ28_00009494 [Nothophytophthora sp. Chile5]
MTACVAISCTKHGQVRVPCQDELLLDKSERFLLTLFGHSCYTMNIASTEPLEVFFYDPRGLQSGQDGPDLPERRRLGEPPLDTSGGAVATLGNGHLCHNMRSCDQLKRGLSRSAMYNLVISRSRSSDMNTTSDDAEQEETTTSVFIELEHCDPVSPWHYAGS